MKLQFKLAGSIAACILVLILGIGIGSVFVPPQDIIKIIFSKIAQKEIYGIESTFVAIVWNVRLPRVLAAFLAGGSLAVSVAVMQSILKNDGKNYFVPPKSFRWVQSLPLQVLRFFVMSILRNGGGFNFCCSVTVCPYCFFLYFIIYYWPIK